MRGARSGPAGTQVIYGLHAVQALLARHPERVLGLKIVRGREDSRSRELETLARRHGRPVERVDAEALTRALGEVVHQGIVAEIVPLAAWSEDELLSAIAERSGAASAPAPLLLALDGVQDPHNLGACLRTADACGALAVIVPRDRAAQLTPAVRKVAAGAAESTPVVACTNLARTLALLKGAGVWAIGADAEAERDAREVDLTVSAVLVLGGEGRGLRQLTRQRCDVLVRLPRLGAVESLNVSVAAGMLLYEAVRQRSAAARVGISVQDAR
ncbi:MAG: 23S rRNA (guanosine(2251)-2'-O)-methyltransferase RlmB [Steroidobacteraceae bacterium]